MGLREVKESKVREENGREGSSLPLGYTPIWGVTNFILLGPVWQRVNEEGLKRRINVLSPFDNPKD